MDQFTQTPFDNPGFSTPQPQPRNAGGIARATGFAALWAGHRKMLLLGVALTGAAALLPQNANPFHYLARGLGMMDAEEIRAAMAAKAEAARLLVAAQAEEQALVQSIQASMAAQIAIGQMGDLACIASQFFAPGRASDYPELRDALRMGCGLSEAAREAIIRNLVFRLRDLRARIAVLEAAAR